VIGAGISGMGGRMLWRVINRVVLFEAGNRLGGQCPHPAWLGRKRTRGGRYRIYPCSLCQLPHLTALFDHLSVPVVKKQHELLAVL